MRALLLFTLVLAGSPAAHALTDTMGKPVKPGNYRRIVSIAPATTELLYAAGWSDRIVGVSDYCDYPAAARHKPRVGAAETLSIERVLALKPDLVLAVPSKAPVLKQLARLLEAPVVTLDYRSLEAIATQAEQLGEILGPEGKRFAERFRKDLAAIPPSHDRPTVFYMVWDKPLMTAGTGTFLHDLIGRAGGQNMASRDGYIPYSEEALLGSQPDVVLYPDNLRSATTRLRARLPHTRFVSLPADAVSRPGPRVLEALRLTARAFDRK